MAKYGVLKLLLICSVMFSGGCASVFYPDFEDDTDIVVDDGGKVEVRKVESKEVLVADTSNALYEGEEDKASEVDTSVENEEDTIVADVDVKNEKAEVVNESQDNQLQKPAMRYLAGIVYFADGGAEVDTTGYTVLRKVAQTAKKNNAEVEVYGFASSRTRNTDPVSHKLANFKVSSQRADKVAAILRNLGVKGDNINVQALSDSVPLYKEVMPEGERLNRRAEIYLTY